MFKYWKHWPILALAALLLAGCGQNSTPSGAAKVAEDIDGAKFRMTTAPAGAKGVKAVRQDAKDGDEVVIVGRVGGSRKPLVAGRAAFTIVDTSFVPCNERADDACPTPWDYCCDPKDALAKGTATIKFVTPEGKTIEQDSRNLLGIKELQTVTVRGKAKRDAEGNLTVLAEQIYIAP